MDRFSLLSCLEYKQVQKIEQHLAGPLLTRTDIFNEDKIRKYRNSAPQLSRLGLLAFWYMKRVKPHTPRAWREPVGLRSSGPTGPQVSIQRARNSLESDGHPSPPTYTISTTYLQSRVGSPAPRQTVRGCGKSQTMSVSQPERISRRTC